MPPPPFRLVGWLRMLCMTVGSENLCNWLQHFYLVYSSCTRVAGSRGALIVVCKSLGRAPGGMAGYGLPCPICKL